MKQQKSTFKNHTTLLDSKPEEFKAQASMTSFGLCHYPTDDSLFTSMKLYQFKNLPIDYSHNLGWSSDIHTRMKIPQYKEELTNRIPSSHFFKKCWRECAAFVDIPIFKNHTTKLIVTSNHRWYVTYNEPPEEEAQFSYVLSIDENLRNIIYPEILISHTDLNSRSD